MERRNQARGANEWSDVYGSIGAVPGVQLLQVPIERLEPWRGENGEPQPFRMYSPDKLQELADSIRTHGVLEAIRVRPYRGRYQILAGHNRVKAAAMAGKRTIPAIVEDVDDNEAILILVDSNLQHREQLLPSEKAKAYQMRLDALKHQGRREDSTSRQVVGKSESADLVGQESGESGRQVQRYVRLNYLQSELLELVNEDKIGLTAGVDLSYMVPESQAQLVSVMQESGMEKISGSQARMLRKNPAPDAEEIRQVLNIGIAAKAVRDLPIKLDISKYPSRVLQRLRRDADFKAAMQKAMEQYITACGIMEE